VLRRLNLTKEEAFKIIDTLMVRGKRYQETMFLLNGKLPVTFQTRLMGDTDVLTEVLETRRPQLLSSFQVEHWRFYLAASIVRYGKQTFSSEKLDDYDDRVSWVNGLQKPVFDMLVAELQKFDYKIAELLKPTFLRNF
jgi:hypothetical protein